MLGETLVRYRWWLSALAILVFFAALPLSRRLTLDRQITSMFAADDPVVLQYEKLQSSFGGNVVAMLVYRDVDLLSEEGIRRNQRLTDRIAALDGVRGVLSPAKLNEVVSAIRPPVLFNFNESARQPALADPDDSVAIGFLDLFAGYTHSEDRTYASVVAILDPQHPPATISELQQIATEIPKPMTDGVVVGEPVLVNDGFDLIQRDGAKLASWTIALLSLVIIVALRSLRYTVLVVVCIAWAVVVTRALMVAIDVQLSIVSTILTAIVTVIVVASVLHLGVMEQKNQSSRVGRRQHAGRVLQRLWIPITWTCLTDAAGFLSLVGSSIRPVREFGMMIGVSAIASLVSLLLVAPLAMSFGSDSNRPAMLSDKKHLMTRGLRRLSRSCIDHRRFVIWIALIVGVGSFMGATQAKTETSFLKNFRSDSPLVDAYSRVETNFGGAGVWDVVVPAPDVLTVEYLESVRSLQDTLRSIEVDGQQLSKVISMADAEVVASQVRLLSLGPPEIRMTAMRAVLPVFADALLTPSGESPRRLRIMLRSREQLTTETKTELIGAVRRAVESHTTTETWRAMLEAGRLPSSAVTGYYVMLAELVGRLVVDQWWCFALSFAFVLGLLWWMTGSLRLAGVAVFANGLPAMVVLALIGTNGGKLNLGAAMIAAVSIGLSIDGSVHLLHNYLRKRMAGGLPVGSAVSAATAVGTPMVLAMLALVIGFGVLSTSDFVPTATFGLLVAATLVLGTLINLTILPASIVFASADGRSEPLESHPAGLDD